MDDFMVRSQPNPTTDHSESRSEPVTADEARAFLTFAVKPDTLAGDLQAAVRLLQAEATQSANTRLHHHGTSVCSDCDVLVRLAQAEQEREIGALASIADQALWGPAYQQANIGKRCERCNTDYPNHSETCPFAELAEALANPSSAAQAHDEQVRREAVAPYAGIIHIIENANEQGVTLHVATRATCAEHIEARDDTPEARALLANDGDSR